MFKLFKLRKTLAFKEFEAGNNIATDLEKSKEYNDILMEANIAEVRLNDGIKLFMRYRDLLKIEAVNRNLMIKKLIDKVEEDLGAVSFIMGSIKEIEIKTDFLIKE